MTDRKKIGVQVDSDLWAEFRAYVQDRKGQTRGVLSDELENAIREYIYDAGDASTEERLRRVEQKLDVALSTSDGGSPPSSSLDESPPARAPTGGDPPRPNAPRREKAEWVAGEFELDADSVLPRAAVEKKIAEEWAFGSEATAALVEATADVLDLEPHPEEDGMFAGSARVESVLSEEAEAATDAASERFDELDEADRGERVGEE